MRPANVNPLNILVIEDNPTDLYMLEKLLQSSRLEIGSLQTATTLQDAAQQLKIAAVDLVLLDLSLPDSAGIDSFLYIQSITPTVPVIILSGNTDEDVAIEAIKNGAQDFLFKGEISASLLYKSIQYSLERKRNLTRLWKSNERFTAVAKATNGAVWDWDLKKDTIWWGVGFKQLFGYENVETGAESWYDHIHPDDRDWVLKAVHHVIDQGGTYWSGEYRFLKADGSYAYVLDRGYTIKDEHGEASQMVGSMMDITASKKAEQALKESEERFRSLADQAPMFIWIAGEDAHVTYANKAMLDYFGLTSYKEIFGQNWRQWVHPADETYVQEMFAYAYETRKPYELECRMRSVSGQYRWLYYKGVPLYLKDKKFGGFIGTAIDIDDRKQAEAALSESEERLRIAVESTQLGTWDFYPITGDLIWSASCKRMFGVQPDVQVDFDLFLQALHPDDRERTKLEIINALKPGSGGNFNTEYRVIGIEDKGLRWVQSIGRAFFNHEGVAYRFIGMVMDITQQKLATETLERSAELLERMVQERTHELQETNEHLKKSNAELEQFAYVASHDLQEPLRKILIFSDQLQSSVYPRLTPSEQVWFEKIRYSAKRMSILIKDLLEYSRLINQTRHDQFVPIDLNKVVAHILTDLEVLILQKGAIIKPDKLPVIDAVEVQMNQLFYNILSNSLKFNAPGRPLEITITSAIASKEELKRFNLSIEIEHYKLVFSDNGIGFNQEFAEQIFTVFQRLHTKEQYPGTGIGLALCRRVAENHKGVIYAEGAENGGARFIAILPVKQ